MTSFPHPPVRRRQAGRSRAAAAAGLAALALLAACGEKKDRPAGDAAARVDGHEIAVQQVEAVLQQQRNLRPEQADAASRQILERLIDQQLVLARVDDLKLDRDPRVVQQLEAARREVLARAYAEKVGEAAPRPTPEEIRQYYLDKPALFAERRIYSIQEIAIEARPDQVPLLRERLSASRNVAEFVEFLKAGEFKFSGTQSLRAAEQLPIASLETFARMKDGQAVIVNTASGVQVVVLAGSRSQPVSEEQARPAIEQYLLNERRRRLVEDDIKALRFAAKIDYVGRFAELAASAPLPAASAPAAAGLGGGAASTPK